MSVVEDHGGPEGYQFWAIGSSPSKVLSPLNVQLISFTGVQDGKTGIAPQLKILCQKQQHWEPRQYAKENGGSNFSQKTNDSETQNILK